MTLRLPIAIRAARAAGKVLQDKFAGTREIHSKGKRDIVTDADYAADHTLRAIIHARFPHDQFISEEDDATTRKALWARARTPDELALWIMDPLDGTTNYVHRLPVFSVSLALFQANAVQIGVVYDPIREELFAAERGGGAHLNGKPIRVSATRVFDDAVIGVEWARKQKSREHTSSILRRMLARVMTARAFGSAALSLCYLATGRLDGYLHLSLSPWDVAAAALIVEEAGGRVTTPAGRAWDVHAQAYVASNGHLHAQMLRFFR
jgi:myo-inositol-1(or 4)-monophosphatase